MNPGLDLLSIAMTAVDLLDDLTLDTIHVIWEVDQCQPESVYVEAYAEYVRNFRNPYDIEGGW